MKVESPQFTQEQIEGFVTDYLVNERTGLVQRLRDVVDEVDTLVSKFEHKVAELSDSWEPVEVLAHMVTSSQYFGWLAHKVVAKQEVGNILQMLRMRDDVTVDAAQRSPSDLAGQLRQNVERTIKFLESTDPIALRTTFDYVGISMTAEDVVRIPLCSHLESHVDQIREAMG